MHRPAKISLEYHENSTNSHKFWDCISNDDGVITSWGRIGTKGKKKTVKEFDAGGYYNQAELEYFAKQKVDKGYKMIKSSGISKTNIKWILGLSDYRL